MRTRMVFPGRPRAATCLDRRWLREISMVTNIPTLQLVFRVKRCRFRLGAVKCLRLRIRAGSSLFTDHKRAFARTIQMCIHHSHSIWRSWGSAESGALRTLDRHSRGAILTAIQLAISRLESREQLMLIRVELFLVPAKSGLFAVHPMG